MAKRLKNNLKKKKKKKKPTPVHTIVLGQDVYLQGHSTQLLTLHHHHICSPEIQYWCVQTGSYPSSCWLLLETQSELH